MKDKFRYFLGLYSNIVIYEHPTKTFGSLKSKLKLESHQADLGPV